MPIFLLQEDLAHFIQYMKLIMASSKDSAKTSASKKTPAVTASQDSRRFLENGEAKIISTQIQIFVYRCSYSFIKM